MPLKPDAVVDLVARQLGAESVREMDRIVEDLGAESMDIVNIIAAVEEDFVLHIDEAELPEIRTVGDLVALVARRTATT